MSRRLVLFVLVAIVAATVATITHEQMRVVGVIVKFEKSLLDVKTKEGKTISIEIDAVTKITLNKKPVGREELKVGRTVAVDATGDSVDELFAISVVLAPQSATPRP